MCMGVVGVCGGTSGIETGISLEFSPITTILLLNLFGCKVLRN